MSHLRLVVCAMLLMGCAPDLVQPTVPDTRPVNVPVIVAVTPDTLLGSVMTPLTIRGQHFARQVTVTLVTSGLTIRVPQVPANDSIIQFLPPQDDTFRVPVTSNERPPMPLPSGRYTVHVTTGAGTSNSVSFFLVTNNSIR